MPRVYRKLINIEQNCLPQETDSMVMKGGRWRKWENSVGKWEVRMSENEIDPIGREHEKAEREKKKG